MKKTLQTKITFSLLFCLGLINNLVFAQVAADGDYSEWATYGTVVASNNGVTIKAFDSGDSLFLYISGTDLAETNNIYINTDGDPGTGFNQANWEADEQGAEALIQGAFAYSSIHTTGNGGWGWNFEQSLVSHFFHTPTEIELSFYMPNFPISDNMTIGADITDSGVPIGVPINGFGNGWAPYTLQDAILPIELGSFRGEANRDFTNELTWATSSEVNNDYFEIQKSIDGRNWENADKIKGAGNSSSKQSYNWTDEKPYLKTYYRLKQADFSGVFSYSSVIFILNEKDIDISISPNPAFNEVNISSEKLKQDATLRLYDQMGRDLTNKVTIERSSDVSIRFNCTNLNNGMYLIHLGDSIHRIQIAK